MNFTNISSIDLKYLDPLLSIEARKWFFGSPGNEHYQLLAYFSNLYNDIIILDIGSYKGASALALSHNLKNTVYSYDVGNFLDCDILSRPNIIYRVGDIIQEKELIEQASIIVLDTDHDGVFEHKFYNFLCETKFSGYLILDDINLNNHMIEFWKSITKEKYDLTSVGHFSGTGLVIFNS